MVDKKKDLEAKDEQTPEEAAAQPTDAVETDTPAAEEAAAEKVAAEEAAAEEAAAEEAAAEEAAAEEAAAEEAAAEEAAAEEAAAEEAAAEEAAAEEAATEEAAAEEVAPAPAARDAKPGRAAREVEPIGRVEGVAAFFDHPKHLMAAAERARDSQYKDFEAFSPFPIHGMDEAMGLGRSWIPWVTMGAATLGFILANWMQFGMMTYDWPQNIGGKPFAPWPSFVPVMFEVTVLLAGVTTVFVMLKAAGCFKKPLIIDPRITQDRFVLWISAADKKFEVNEAIDFLETLNPMEIRKVVKDA